MQSQIETKEQIIENIEQRLAKVRQILKSMKYYNSASENQDQNQELNGASE